MKQIYLDNAATTKVDEKVVKAMLPYFSEKFGNASSQHLVGQEAKRALEESRTIIAKSIGAKDDEIIFTLHGVNRLRRRRSREGQGRPSVRSSVLPESIRCGTLRVKESGRKGGLLGVRRGVSR